MADCELKKPEPLEQVNPNRNAPKNRAMALAFTLHDFALDLYGFSLVPHPHFQTATDGVLDMIEAQIIAYRIAKAQEAERA